MLGEIISRSPKTVSDLSCDQAHADDMTKLGLFSKLLPDLSRNRRLTAANTMHQSSHPTLLTSHIRVAKRNPMIISTTLRASIDVASNPPDLSALPIGGGVVGFSILIHCIQEFETVDLRRVLERRSAQNGLDCTQKEIDKCNVKHARFGTGTGA